jgi:hypothetical protein
MDWRDILKTPKGQEIKKVVKVVQEKREEVSQVSQVLNSGKCGNCQHHENISGVGNGCVQELPSDQKYTAEWSLIDLLKTCPHRHWH